MKTSTLSNMKFLRLKRRLKMPQFHVVGLLESIWIFTATSASDGAIGRFTNEDIAAAIDWQDDADELIKCLIETGWIDESEEFRLVIHDWHDHAPTFVKGNLKSQSRQFAGKSQPTAKGGAKHDETAPSPTAKGGAKGGAKPTAKGGATYSILSNSIQSNSSSSTPPGLTGSAADAAGGGGGPDADDWEPVREAMARLGIRERETAINAARSHGIKPEFAAKFCEWFSLNGSDWPRGALPYALGKLSPEDTSRPFADLLPPKPFAPDAEREQQDRERAASEKRFRDQQAANAAQHRERDERNTRFDSLRKRYGDTLKSLEREDLLALCRRVLSQDNATTIAKGGPLGKSILDSCEWQLLEALETEDREASV